MKTGGIEPYLKKNIPQFEISGGKLHLEHPLHYEDSDIYVDINTSEDHHPDFHSNEIRTKMALYDVFFLADSERMLYQASSGTGLNYGDMLRGEVWFSDLGDVTFSKSDMLSLLPMFRIIAVSALIFAFLFQLAALFMQILLLSGFGMLLSCFLRVRLKFGQVFRLSAYAYALPVFLSGILRFFGIEMGGFVMFGFLYAVFVLSMVYGFLETETKNMDFETPKRQAPCETKAETTAETAAEIDRAETAEDEPGKEKEEKKEKEDEIARKAREEAEKRADARVRMLIPDSGRREDISPSEGWSFGTRDTEKDNSSAEDRAENT